MSSISINTDITVDFNFNFLVNNTSYPAPLTIINTTSNQITVTLNFTGNLWNTNDYIIIGSSNLKFDAQNSPITVSTNNFGGLFQNNSGYTNIIMQNITITESITISTGSGYICQQGFSNGTVIDC